MGKAYSLRLRRIIVLAYACYYILSIYKTKKWRKYFEDFNFCSVARDVPGGKRILIIKINAQHNALSKAI